MASKRISRWLFGKQSKKTTWGLAGQSHSMHNGGYERFFYGVKGIVSLQVYHGWGDYCSNTFD
jgi:hypothetical protein